MFSGTSNQLLLQVASCLLPQASFMATVIPVLDLEIQASNACNDHLLQNFVAGGLPHQFQAAKIKPSEILNSSQLCSLSFPVL
jgi:hypothetical protein